jgi:hypothetical protein
LLRLSKASFYLLLLLHSHVWKVISTRCTWVLLLHPLHLLLLAHLFLLLWQVSRHFSFFAHRISFLKINLGILALKVLREVLTLGLLRGTRRWSSIWRALQAAQISTDMQCWLRSSLLLLVKRNLMIKLLKDKLRVI